MIRRFFASSFTLVLWALQIESALSDNAPETVTFNQHIAPIILEHCTPCHREGMSAPFQLLTYEDTRRRAKQIKEVTESKYMPPWLPEPVDGGFKHERGLSDQQIRLIKSWLDTGSKEGDDTVRPSIPDWPGDWQLGEPDLFPPYGDECSSILCPACKKDSAAPHKLPCLCPTQTREGYLAECSPKQ